MYGGAGSHYAYARPLRVVRSRRPTLCRRYKKRLERLKTLSNFIAQQHQPCFHPFVLYPCSPSSVRRPSLWPCLRRYVVHTAPSPSNDDYASQANDAVESIDARAASGTHVSSKRCFLPNCAFGGNGDAQENLEKTANKRHEEGGEVHVELLSPIGSKRCFLPNCGFEESGSS